MKKQFRQKLIHYFRSALLQARADKTQEEMAEKLDMSLRAYQKLESGKTCCGLYTLWRYWVYICEDRESFLFGLFHLLDTAHEAAA